MGGSILVDPLGWSSAAARMAKVWLEYRLVTEFAGTLELFDRRFVELPGAPSAAARLAELRLKWIPDISMGLVTEFATAA